MRIPFGASVIYKPKMERAASHTEDWEASGRPGIFAGYTMGPGYIWKGTYKVWDLDDFLTMDFDAKAKKLPANLRTPHTTDTVALPVAGLSFPLKAHYDKRNYSFEGRLGETDAVTFADEAAPPLPGPSGSPPAGGEQELDPVLEVGRSIRREKSDGAHADDPPVSEGAVDGVSPVDGGLDAERKSDKDIGIILDGLGRRCKVDTLGRLYEVDDSGVRMTARGSSRPPDFTSRDWWNIPEATRVAIRNSRGIIAPSKHRRGQLREKLNH